MNPYQNQFDPPWDPDSRTQDEVVEQGVSSHPLPDHIGHYAATIPYGHAPANYDGHYVATTPYGYTGHINHPPAINQNRDMSNNHLYLKAAVAPPPPGSPPAVPPTHGGAMDHTTQTPMYHNNIGFQQQVPNQQPKLGLADARSAVSNRMTPAPAAYTPAVPAQTNNMLPFVPYAQDLPIPTPDAGLPTSLQEPAAVPSQHQDRAQLRHPITHQAFVNEWVSTVLAQLQNKCTIVPAIPSFPTETVLGTRVFVPEDVLKLRHLQPKDRYQYYLQCYKKAAASLTNGFSTPWESKLKLYLTFAALSEKLVKDEMDFFKASFSLSINDTLDMIESHNRSYNLAEIYADPRKPSVAGAISPGSASSRTQHSSNAVGSSTMNLTITSLTKTKWKNTDGSDQPSKSARTVAYIQPIDLTNDEDDEGTALVAQQPPPKQNFEDSENFRGLTQYEEDFKTGKKVLNPKHKILHPRTHQQVMKNHFRDKYTWQAYGRDREVERQKEAREAAIAKSKKEKDEARAARRRVRHAAEKAEKEQKAERERALADKKAAEERERAEKKAAEEKKRDAAEKKRNEEIRRQRNLKVHEGEFELGTLITSDDEDDDQESSIDEEHQADSEGEDGQDDDSGTEGKSIVPTNLADDKFDYLFEEQENGDDDLDSLFEE